MTDQELLEKVRAVRDHLYEAAAIAHELSVPLPGAKFNVPEPGVRLKQLISDAREELQRSYSTQLFRIRRETDKQNT